MAKKIEAKGNILDLLLNMDVDALVRPKKRVAIKRLSEILGVEMVFECQGLTPDQMEEIQENCMTVNGGDVDLNMNDMQIFTILEGVVEPNLKSKELRDKFSSPTPKELVKKLLLSGEITKIYGVISELSGYGENAVEEIKN